MSVWQRLFRANKGKEDLDAEIAAHLALCAADKREQGVNSEAAQQQARREFGNVALVKDVTRQAWGWVWVERLVQDLKYALRQLRKSPGFAITAILTLALGIGANIAIFQLIYAVMLRSLPVAHPEELVQFRTQFDKDAPNDYLHNGMYKGLSGQHTLAGMCGWLGGRVTDHVGETPVALDVPMITGDCFRMLGVRPLLGRLLAPADDTPEPGPQGYAAVLSYAYWNSRYHRDPKVIGEKVVVEDLFSRSKPLVIVGVLPPSFHGLMVGEDPELYLPSYFMGTENRDELPGVGNISMLLFGRLKPGQNVTRAQEELQPLFYSWLLESKNDEAKKAKHAALLLQRNAVGASYMALEYGKQLKLLQIMVAMILVAGCAYLSTLLSARSVVRRREFALRTALGASRGRLVMQMAIESALLVFAGAGLGLLLAWRTAKFLIDFISGPGQKIALDLRPGGWVLLFAAGVSAITILLMTVLPAWRASRTNVVADIKETKTSLLTARRGKLGSFLVPIQVALSLLVVVVSALSAVSLMRLLKQHNGYRMGGTVFVQTDVPVVNAGKDKDDDKLKTTLAMYDVLLDRLNHTPDIRSASLDMTHPLGHAFYTETFTSKSRGLKQTADGGPLTNKIGPRYFEAVGTKLLAGREFQREDNLSAQPVCILSRSAAQYYFPGMPPMGQVLTEPGETKVDRVVVGVVEDTRFESLNSDTTKMVYLPAMQTKGFLGAMEIVLRTDDVKGSVAVLGEQLHRLGSAHVARVVSMQEEVKDATSSTRLLSLLSSSLAGLALLLSAVGIFGLLSYSVSQRTTEIGVRMALGASRGHIFMVLLRQAAMLVLPGVVMGAVAAVLTTRFMASMLYQTKPLDPLALIASIVALLLVSAVASYLPASRAARIEPMEALRAE